MFTLLRKGAPAAACYRCRNFLEDGHKPGCSAVVGEPQAEHVFNRLNDSRLFPLAGMPQQGWRTYEALYAVRSQPKPVMVRYYSHDCAQGVNALEGRTVYLYRMINHPEWLVFLSKRSYEGAASFTVIRADEMRSSCKRFGSIENAVEHCERQWF